MRRILTIDGGGVRGIIPAVLLAELESRTGKLTRDVFDFVGGTSTGAVLAAGIAAGIPAERLVSVYAERSPHVFRRVPVLGTLRRIVDRCDVRHDDVACAHPRGAGSGGA